MDAIHILQAVEQDTSKLISVIQSSFLESVAPRWSASAVQLFLEKDSAVDKLLDILSRGHICLKAVEAEKIRGCLLFSSASKLSYLFVHPMAYRQGIARALFSEALKQLDDSVENITLNSSEFAVPAYENLGFNKSEPSFNYNGCVFQPMAFKVK